MNMPDLHATHTATAPLLCAYVPLPHMEHSTLSGTSFNSAGFATLFVVNPSYPETHTEAFQRTSALPENITTLNVDGGNNNDT